MKPRAIVLDARVAMLQCRRAWLRNYGFRTCEILGDRPLKGRPVLRFVGHQDLSPPAVSGKVT